jgi:hypothetical protein
MALKMSKNDSDAGQSTINGEKTFFLPPIKKSEKAKPSYKEPFPDRIGDQINGTWIIPNETSTVTTSFDSSKSSNFSLKANITSSLVQLNEDDNTDETKNATVVKPLISSSYYDAEGNYYPVNGDSNSSKNE